MARSTDEEQATYGRIGEWWNEHADAGRIIEGHELQPSSTATTVRIGPDGGDDGHRRPVRRGQGDGRRLRDPRGARPRRGARAGVLVARAATTLEIRPIVERDATS